MSPGIDYLDTSLFLGSAFEEEQKCRKQLDLVGYKQKNGGLITHFVVGEVFVNIFLKVEHENPKLEEALRINVFTSINDIITGLYRDGRLSILKIPEERIDCELIAVLMEENHDLTYDDALHISIAIKTGCERFVTTDQALIDDVVFREYLRREHGLKIKAVDLRD